MLLLDIPFFYLTRLCRMCSVFVYVIILNMFVFACFDDLAGNWIHALKRVLKSVYSYFSYDTNSYIASKLEYQSKNGNVNWDQLELRSDYLYGREQQNVDDTEEENDTDPTDEEDDDDEGDDEDDDNDDDESDQSPRNTMEYNRKSLERDLYVVPAISGNSLTTSKPPTKLVSSFTVENILMGRQCSSSSSNHSSSTRTTAASAAAAAAHMHSPTRSLRPVAAASISQAMPSCTSSTSSSIVGVNWVSHPPVKYTKFTMLSPTAMSDEANKKRKPSVEHPAVLNPKSFKAVGDSQESNLTKNKDMQITSLMPSSQVTCAQPVSSNLVCEAAANTAASSSVIQVYPITSLKELPTCSSSLTTTPTRLCTLPVVTTLPPITSLDQKSVMSSLDRKSAITNLDRKSTITSPDRKSAITSLDRKSAVTSVDRKSATSKAFHPSQQYVFIVPSNSVAVSPSSQHSAVDNSNLSGRTIKTVVVGSRDTTASNIKTATFQNSLSITSSRIAIATTAESSVGKPIPSTNVLSESNSNNFRFIAPKKNTPPSPPSQDRGTRKSKVLKRMSQKPHKLRFHMTTVVTKQKREPVRGSMTVESPSAVNSDVTETSNTPPSSKREDNLDRTVAIESAITSSPNMHSAEANPQIMSNEERVVEFCKEIKLKEVEEMKLNSQTRKRVNISSSGKRKGEKDAIFSSIKHIAEPRAKGRATRNYTRRKRELTFHLYEDPETAFRVKRACKE